MEIVSFKMKQKNVYTRIKEVVIILWSDNDNAERINSFTLSMVWRRHIVVLAIVTTAMAFISEPYITKILSTDNVPFMML